VRQPATEPGEKIEQPQPLVRLHSLAFSPVAFVFPVAPTEPSNTNNNDNENGRDDEWGPNDARRIILAMGMFFYLFRVLHILMSFLHCI
jgi:hypothetical protein